MCLCEELEDPDVRAYVGVHEHDAGRPGADRQGRRAEGAQLQGQVRVPASVTEMSNSARLETRIAVSVLFSSVGSRS